MTALKTKFIIDMVDRITAPVRSMRSNYLKSVVDMQAATRRLRENIQQVGRATTNIGKNLSIGMSAPIALAGGLAVKAAASMESMMASLNTVMGSKPAANSAMAQIKEFSTTTPFQMEEVLASFIKLKALGLDPSMAALKSYGNTSSAMGRSLDQFIEAVADASTGEFERLKEFGIKASVQGKKVSFIFQGVKTTVKNDAASIQNYLRSIGDVNFAGAMDEKMSTFNGIMSNLEDTISATTNNIGRQITETLDLKDFFRGLASSIQWAGDAFMGLPVGAKNFIVIAGLIMALLGPIIMGIGQLTIGIAGMVWAFGFIAPILAPAILALKAFGIALFTTPVGWFVLGIAAIAGAAFLIYKNWGAVSDWFASMWQGIKSNTAAAVDFVMTVLSPLLNAISIVSGGAGSLIRIARGMGTGGSRSPSMAPQAPAAAASSSGSMLRNQVDMGGTLDIRISSDGNPSVLRAQPNDQRMGFSVDQGILMGPAR